MSRLPLDLRLRRLIAFGPWADAWIRLADGTAYNLLRPDPAAITLDNLSIGLANTCRFGGQLPRGVFYSVAEHSWLLALMVPRALRLPALLHDASEALGLGDMVSPLKRRLPAYRLVEQLHMRAVAQAFGLDPAVFDDPELKLADRRMMVTEQRGVRGIDLQTLPPDESGIEPFDLGFPCCPPAEAQGMFRDCLTAALEEDGKWRR